MEMLIHQHPLQRPGVPSQTPLLKGPEKDLRGDPRWRLPRTRVHVKVLAKATFPKADGEIAVRPAHVQVDDDGSPMAVDNEVQAPLAAQAPDPLDVLGRGNTRLGQLLRGQDGRPAVAVVDGAVVCKDLVRQRSARLGGEHVERRGVTAPLNEFLQDNGMLFAGRKVETPQLLLLHVQDDAVAAGSPRRLQHEARATGQLAAQSAHRLPQLLRGRSDVPPGPTHCGRGPSAGSWQGVPQRRDALPWIDVRMKPSFRTAELADAMIGRVPNGWHPVTLARHGHGGGQVHGVKERAAECRVCRQRRHHLVEGQLRRSRCRPGGAMLRERVKPQGLPCAQPLLRRPRGPKLLHLPEARQGDEVDPGPRPRQAARAPLDELVVAPRFRRGPPREEDRGGAHVRGPEQQAVQVLPRELDGLVTRARPFAPVERGNCVR
mmetsp:Transcript_62242/g.190129  ORF Transcript_62242/g.190129 Transcript_62242/m.190129 type:complete len:433 (+) Transcript_62242:436-1734(+)